MSESLTFSTIQTQWAKTDMPLQPYNIDNVDASKLNANTKDYLSICGLPKDCAPFISFGPELTSINQLYRLDAGDEFEQYIVFGSDGAGNPICIDIQQNDSIVIVEHETYFAETTFLNSSILQMSYCLYWYNEFYQSLVNAESFELRKFSDEEFQQLKDKIITADPACMTENSFWESNLSMLLIERDED